MALLILIALLNRQTVRFEAKSKRKQTVPQSTLIVEHRTALLKRIQRFREIQQIYMPDFDPDNTPTSVDIEECKLYLPSDLLEADRQKYCPGDLTEMENRLRFAEAFDALESLRHHLRTRSAINRFKVANVTGQVRNTRARETQSRIDNKVQSAALQYRRSRNALVKLREHGPWEDILQVLEVSDVRALNEREMTAQEQQDIRRVQDRVEVVGEDDVSPERVVATAAAVGEGQRRPSWIWSSGNLQEGADDPITRAGAFPSLLY